MKVNVNEHAARALVDLLEDEQPGSVLSELRDRLEDGLSKTEGRRNTLTARELTHVIAACLDAEERLMSSASLAPKFAEAKADALSAMATAVPKLQAMQRQQEARESRTFDGGGHAAGR